jgi:hypothetical protein
MTMLISLLALALAAAPAPKTDAPEALIDAYERAIGGAAAWGKLKSIKVALDLKVKGLGMQGSAEILQKPPAKMLTTMEIPGIGKLRTGSSGKQAWADDPINGLRVLAGTEAEQARLESTWNAEVNLRKLYPTIRAHAPDADGHPCVELVPRGAPAVVRCFDATTHLPVTETGVQSSPQGQTPYVRKFRDWRPIDGASAALIPWTTELSAGPMTIELVVRAVTPNAPIADAAFAPPKPTK